MKKGDPYRHDLKECPYCKSMFSGHATKKYCTKKCAIAFAKDTGLTRGAQLRSKFGIDLRDFDEMLRNQVGRCAICKSEDPGSKHNGNFAVDHCHKTGKIRGLLCVRCNSILGYARDTISILREAIEYLERNG